MMIICVYVGAMDGRVVWHGWVTVYIEIKTLEHVVGCSHLTVTPDRQQRKHPNIIHLFQVSYKVSRDDNSSQGFTKLH